MQIVSQQNVFDFSIIWVFTTISPWTPVRYDISLFYLTWP